MNAKNRQDIDPILRNGRDTDIVIPIMGATGAGKSSFINWIIGREEMKVGHSLTSETVSLAPVIIDPIPNSPKLRGCRLVIVDTPGFDDTYVGDAEILRRIATWLGVSYKKKMVLGGVIYLHDISQDRFGGTARRNLDMFNSLCGDAALDKVVLATAKWSRVSLGTGEGREQELESDHWKSMVDKDAKVRRFMGDSTSGWKILDVFLQRASERHDRLKNELGLQIQNELIKDKKLIPQTKAGKKLRYTLEEVLETQRQLMALEKEVAGNKGADIDTQGQLEEKKRNMKKLVGDIQTLKVSIPQRIRKFLGLLESEVNAV